MPLPLGRVVVLTVCLWLAPTVSLAQEPVRWFAGGLAGVSTLSADAQHELSMETLAVSLYKPENGLAANVFVGNHLTEYVTVQANYMWNQNDLTLLSSHSDGGSTAFYEQSRSSSQHAVVGDFLLYFRSRASGVRPYLSVGGGVLRVDSTSRGETVIGGAIPPEPELTEHRPVLRVAVGIDLKTGQNWSVRYSFSESLSRNPISQQLSPPAPRRLANFQNLVGVVRAF